MNEQFMINARTKEKLDELFEILEKTSTVKKGKFYDNSESSKAYPYTQYFELEEKPKVKKNERGAGRKKATLPVPMEMIRMRHDSGDSWERIAKDLNLSRSTLFQLMKQEELDKGSNRV